MKSNFLELLGFDCQSKLHSEGNLYDLPYTIVELTFQFSCLSGLQILPQFLMSRLKNLMLILLSIFGLVVLAVIAIMALSNSATKPSNPDVENAESVDWLPQSATNITSYTQRVCGAFEFSISEKEFVDWVLKDYPTLAVNEISKPVKVLRYHIYCNTGTENDKMLSVVSGLWGLTTHLPDGSYDDGGYDIVYDRKTNMAYYWWQAR